MTKPLREFAERVREKVMLLSGGGPPMIIEATSKEEADRLVAEHEAKWGPDHDVVVIIWPEERAAQATSQIRGKGGRNARPIS